MRDVYLYVKEGEQVKKVKVPLYVVKDLLRDRLSQSELNRIHRFAEPAKTPKHFNAGSVVVDFSTKTAMCFETGLNMEDLEPTWKIEYQETSS